MKQKLSLLTLIVMLLSTLFLASCGGANESATKNPIDNKASGSESGKKIPQQEEKVVRIAYNLPAKHATGIYFEVLAKEIDKLTQETSIHLKPQTFPNGQLFNDSQLPDALTTGGVEIGQLNSGFLAGKEAEALRIVDLPFLFNSWEAEWAAEDGNYGKLFDQQMGKIGMKLLGWPMYGTIELYGNKPIKVTGDIKGMKMRAFGQGASLMLKELGATPVSMSSQEIYQAMDRGTIDGYTTGPSSVVDRSLFEVTKYGTDMTMMYISFQGAANLTWWNSLPEDVQSAVLEASKIAQKESRQAAKESDEKYKQKLDKAGVKQYKPTQEEYKQWVEAASGRYNEYLKKASGIGEQLMKDVEKVNKQNQN